MFIAKIDGFQIVKPADSSAVTRGRGACAASDRWGRGSSVAAGSASAFRWGGACATCKGRDWRIASAPLSEEICRCDYHKGGDSGQSKAQTGIICFHKRCLFSEFVRYRQQIPYSAMRIPDG